MKQNKLIVFIFLVATMQMFAQDISKAGITAAQFLKIGIGPRAIGMGAAFAATADDLSAIYWNPAGVAESHSNQVYFNHTDWIADVSNDFAAIASYIPDVGTVGAFIIVSKSIDGEVVRTNDKPEGTGELFDAGGISIGLTFARNLTDNFSIGFNAKYIQESIWHMKADGFAFDMGVLYKINVLNELRLAASVANFGTKMQLDGRDILEIKSVGEGSQGNLINTKIELGKYDLPLLFRVGVAADVIKESSFRVTAAVDAIHPNDHTEYLNLGTEFAWNEILFARAGLKSLFEKETEQGLTLGVGLNYKLVDVVNVMIDYAYQDFGRMKNVHYLSLGFKF
ncbi:MAG: PorV/PorQ family protein [Bacteroidetes bacterium]|nr:PorV/PorQ family protein [Bacteroidota bacterium]MBU1114807.1 PorV/PorQ family protein [Bacteroidota bacterium]MBU1796999.1 PorV/PorQ family protein [Bacteroidota bacterium]